jgi:predicted MFS family arabinose efflux permease
LAGSAVALIVFGLVELRQEQPMFDVRLFRVPAFSGAQAVAFTISSSMFAMFLYFTLYLQNILRYSPLQAGLRFLPLSMISFFVAPATGRLVGRVPVRVLLGTGMSLITVALYLMHGVKVSSGWTTLLAGFLIGGIGIGMVNPPLATTAVSVVPVQRAGMAAGVNNTFRQVGIATGIAGLGAILQSSYGPGGTPAQFVHGLNAILLVSTFVALAGAVLAFALVRGKDFVASGQAPQAHG